MCYWKVAPSFHVDLHQSKIQQLQGREASTHTHTHAHDMHDWIWPRHLSPSVSLSPLSPSVSSLSLSSLSLSLSLHPPTHKKEHLQRQVAFVVTAMHQEIGCFEQILCRISSSGLQMPFKDAHKWLHRPKRVRGNDVTTPLMVRACQLPSW